MLSILGNFGLIDSEVLVPPGKNLPKGTQLRLASDNLGCLVSLSQQMEKNLPLIFVETIARVKMDANKPYIEIFESYKSR